MPTEPRETLTLSSHTVPPFLLQSSPIADPEPVRVDVTSDEVAFDQDAELVDAERSPEVDVPQHDTSGKDVHSSKIEHDADDWSEVEA